MPLLVRKVNRIDWEDLDDVFAIPSTVILSSFKNDDNTISVWEINSEEELDEAVLALTTCLKSLDTIDVVTLEEEYLDKVTVEYEYFRWVNSCKRFGSYAFKHKKLRLL